MERFKTIQQALKQAGYTAEEVAEELTRHRDGKNFSPQMVYCCYRGFRKWKAWTYPVLAGLIRVRLKDFAELSIEKVEELCIMTREQILAAEANEKGD